LIKTSGAAQQDVEGKPVHPSIDQSRNIRLRKTKRFASLHLRQATALEQSANLSNELCFQQLLWSSQWHTASRLPSMQAVISSVRP
jgi:hypothetical protein